MGLTPLPPLACLQAFEASARYVSFTRAGKELNLSPSAVSRQILQLEEFLGRRLFVRENNALRLTPAGETYAVDVRRMLELCVNSTTNLMARVVKSRLTVSCTAGLSAFWLAPRVGGFLERNPDVDLRIIVRDHFGVVSPAEYDVGIFYLRNPEIPGTHVHKLFDETVHAVCAPDYLDGLCIEPIELLSHTLLVLEDAERGWMSWHGWFERNGVSRVSPVSTIISNSYPLLIMLAMHGKGIALGWQRVIDPLLETGALVKASHSSSTMGGSYYVTWPSERAESAVARRFRAWVAEQVN